MIALKELNPHNYPTTPVIDINLARLLERLNRIREAWGKPMTITSGLRSDEQQQALIAAGKSNAPHSKHLIGCAADILDEDGTFYDWCRANEDLLAEVGLWCENRMGPWQHLQSLPPASGHRWFQP